MLIDERPISIDYKIEMREVEKLHGFTIHALDGEVGRVDEILFDDEHWTVRYLIVDTGNWLFGRKVLLSPMAFGRLDWEQHKLNVNLTREQIKNSPSVNTDEPVSRQWENDYYSYYAWPYYWGGMGVWGGYMYPGALFASSDGYTETPQQKSDDPVKDHASAHLRSTKEITGYKVSATDGSLGHIQDFIVDDDTWRICYLAVDMWNWSPGNKVLLPPDWIGEVNWLDRKVTVNVTLEQARHAPSWEPGQPISRLFEEQLYGYYARQHPRGREQSRFERFDVSTQSELQTPKESQMKSVEQTLSQEKSTVVAVYDTHSEAESAIRELQGLGFDMTKLSIVGKDYHTNEEVVGYYTTGDRMKSWASTGALWGGIWGLLFGSAFFFIPVIGPVLAAGPIVAWIVGAVEGAVVVGGMSAVGAALFSIGIPKDSIIQYETQIKAGKFVVIAHDAAGKLDQATLALEASRHKGVAQYSLHA